MLRYNSKMMLLIGVLLLVLVASPVMAQEEGAVMIPDPALFEWVEFAAGLTRPVYITHAGDESGRLFIVSQDGQIVVHEDGAVLETPFLDVTTLITPDRGNEQGLLGLAFHPDYAENGLFYIHYTDENGDTAVARYSVSDDPLVTNAESGEIILTQAQPYRNHNGGQIAFGPDGYLYIGLGDGGSGNDPEENGQNRAVLLGKLLRIDVNNDEGYAVPADNPFVDEADAAPEIWAWGLRNPWRFSFDRETGDLYVGDVGQNRREEVNFQAADSTGGENYGWNIFEGSGSLTGEEAPEGMIYPIAEYDHGKGCSVTGGYVYRGEDLPELQGVYLFGDYCSGTIWATGRDGAGAWQTVVFMDTGDTISSFGEDEQGELYLVSLGGTIYKLERAG